MQTGHEPGRPQSEAERTGLGQFCSQMLLCFLGGGQEGKAPSCDCFATLAWTDCQLEVLVSWLSPYTHSEVSPESISCLQGLNEVMVIPDVAVWVSLHYGCIWPSHCVCVCVYAHVCACIWMCVGGTQM